MGGDFGPRVTVPAAFSCLLLYPGLTLTFTGDQSAIKAALPADASDFQNSYQIIHTTSVVEMDEQPASALRNKKDSSMAEAITADGFYRGKKVVDVNDEE